MSPADLMDGSGAVAPSAVIDEMAAKL